MNDDDFRQTVLDYFQIEAQRHRDIMTSLSDLQAKGVEIQTSLDGLKTSGDAALADLAAAQIANSSAQLDAVMVIFTDIATRIGVLQTEFTAAILAVPIPDAPVAATPDASAAPASVASS